MTDVQDPVPDTRDSRTEKHRMAGRREALLEAGRELARTIGELIADDAPQDMVVELQQLALTWFSEATA